MSRSFSIIPSRIYKPIVLNWTNKQKINKTNKNRSSDRLRNIKMRAFSSDAKYKNIRDELDPKC